MKFTIEKLDSFQILGSVRGFRNDTCMAEIPKFWDQYFAEGKGEVACGQFGVCIDGKPDGSFRYAIGNACTLETRPDGSKIWHVFNRPDRTEIPAGFEILNIPAHTWLKVECRGPLPQSLQSMYPRMEREWPSEFIRDSCLGIEEYSVCNSSDDTLKEDYQSFIWIPVRPAEAAIDQTI